MGIMECCHISQFFISSNQIYGGHKLLDISFVCAVNNKKIFAECTNSFLTIQNNHNYELIIIDTNKIPFESAAKAYNYGGSRANGKYICFLHQDIIINDNDFIDKLLSNLDSTDFLIAGVAGVGKSQAYGRCALFTNISDGDNGLKDKSSINVSIPKSVESVDECFFIIPKDIYKNRKLNELNNSWHLYSVEYSLWANREKRGSVVVLPLELWHKSNGVSINKDYFKELRNIKNLYHRDIYTTMGMWPQNNILFEIKLIYKKIYYEYKYKKKI